MTTIAEKNACYLFGVIPMEQWEQAAALDLPRGFMPRGELRAIEFEELDLVAVAEPTEQALWVGPEAEEKLKEVKWVGPRAMVHHEVVDELHRQVGVIYPTNLGTIYSDREALRRDLKGRKEALDAYFSQTQGRDQYTLKGLIPRRVDKRSTLEEGEGGGKDYLKRRQRSRRQGLDMEALQADAQQLAACMERWIEARQVDRGAAPKEQDKRRLFCWHVLVDRSCEDGLAEDLAKLAPSLSDALELDIVGPLVPYQFRPREMEEQR